MRDIKFRAWDKDSDKMVFQHDVSVGKEYFFSLSEDNVELLRYDNDYSAYVKCNSEIMQYTGLKDRNRKEIYEGDIVKFLDEKMHYCEFRNEFVNIGKIFFDNCQVMGWDITNRHMGIEEVWHYREYIEVVGNIYESPDLLD